MAQSTILNVVGLALDILGVVLVWRYGLPDPISREGHQYLILEQVDEAEKSKAARFDLLSKCGLSLILAGFCLQLASNFFKG